MQRLKLLIASNLTIKKLISVNRTFNLTQKIVCRVFLGYYKTIVRPHLEYANQVWFPHRVYDLDRTEGKRATEIVTWKISYEQRLRLPKLPNS